MLEVTDDLGCIYYYTFHISCNAPTVKCSRDSHVIVNGVTIPMWTCYDPLDGTGPYTTLTAFGNGYFDFSGDGDPFAECNDGNCVYCPPDI